MKRSSTILVILLVCTFVLGIQKPDSLFAQYRSPDWIVNNYYTMYSQRITAGDINGDGFDDIAINVHEDIILVFGGMFVYYGSPNGPASSPGWSLWIGPFAGSHGLTCKGDVNNDGYADLIVAEAVYPRGIQVFYGSHAGLNYISDRIDSYDSIDYNYKFGFSISSGGDVNGDGFDDLIVGVLNYPLNGHYVGAFIYLGSQDGIITSPAWTVSTSGNYYQGLGHSVSIEGDLNNDGYDDAAVINNYGEGNDPSAHTLICFGSPDRQMFEPPEIDIQNPLINGVGNLTIMNDVNGDSFDDLIMTHVFRSVLLYNGSANGPSQSPDWSFYPPGDPNQIPLCSSSGDFNGDGFNDALVSDYMQYFRSTILFGSNSGFGNQGYENPCVLLSCPPNMSYGDVNGDGYDDALGVGGYAAAYYGAADTIQTMTIAPKFSLHTQKEEVCCSVKVKSQYYLPMKNSTVSFEIVGVNPRADSVVTNSNGIAKITYTPAVLLPGTDTIFINCGRLTDTAIVTWDSPTPVELLGFNSSASGKEVVLKWLTSTELNNSGFEIQRAIENGKWKIESGEWSKIGFVSGGGTTNAPRDYSYADRNLETGKYKYRLKQLDFNGNFEYFELAEVVSIGIPDKYDLSQNYPNPFNPVTTINYDLPNDGIVTIKVYDILGRELKTLVNDMKTAGYHKILFNAADLASGAYFYRMSVGDFVSMKKFVVLK
ncbi:MAG: FG-GAP repeat protein [Ignavibacteria bacterium]|nr:FG-GAP repeat protein [Ignavibacteria bacterium]